MPKNFQLPITDDVSCDCTAYYQIKYRYGANPYTEQTFNSPLPTATLNTIPDTPYIYLPNLIDGQTYDYILTRFCSNGSISSTVTNIFNT